MTLVTGIPQEDTGIVVTDDVDATDPAQLDTVVDDVVAAYVTAHGYGVISDNFNRADSLTSLGTASDGGSWTVDGPAQYGIVGNQARLYSGDGVENRARRDTGQTTADVSVVDVRSGAGATPTATSYIWVAYSPSGDTGYHVAFDSTGTFGVYEWASGVATQLGTDLTGTAWTGSSATIRATYNPATGVVEVFQDGVSLGTRTDGTPITAAGNSWVGLSTSLANSITGETWDSFTAATPAVPEFLNVDLTWEGTAAGPFQRRLSPPPGPPDVPVVPPTPPAPVATVQGIDPVGFADAAATGDVEMVATWGLPDGWLVAVDNLSVLPPAGIYMAVLRIFVSTPVDATFELDVTDGSSPTPLVGFVDPSVPAYSGVTATGGPFVIDEPGSDGILVWAGYSDAAPTAGEVTWRLTVWRIGDIPT